MSNKNILKMKKIFTRVYLLVILLVTGIISVNAQTNYAFKTNSVAYLNANYVMPFTNTDCTIETWVYLDNISQGGSYLNTIMATEDGSNKGFVIRCGQTPFTGPTGLTHYSSWEFVIGDGSTWHTVTSYPAGTPDNQKTNYFFPTTGIWHHLAVVKQADTIRLYRNGQFSNSAVIPGLSGFAANTGKGLRMGESYFTGRFLNGSLDDVKIWNYARTQSDINNDMAAETCLKNTTGLVAYYKLNESNGNNYDDISATNNDAQKNGGSQTHLSVPANKNSFVTNFVVRNDIANLVMSAGAGIFGPICAGDTTGLNAITTTETNPLSYQWQPAGSASNPTIASTVFASDAQTKFFPSTSTNYTLTATNSGGCTLSITDSITVINLPQPTYTLSANSICAGDTVLLTLSANYSNPHYFQVFAADGSAEVVNFTATNDSLKLYPSKSRKYYYRIIDNSGSGCQGKLDSFNITVNGIDSFKTGPLTSCAGDAVQLYANEAGATSYSWSPSTGLSNASIANPTASPTVSTIYTLTVVTPSCANLKKMIAVNVAPKPMFSNTYDPTPCPNTTILYLDAIALPVKNIAGQSGGSVDIDAGTAKIIDSIIVTGVTPNQYKLDQVSLIQTLGEFANVDMWLESPTGQKVWVISDVAISLPGSTGAIEVSNSFPNYNGIPPFFGPIQVAPQNLSPSSGEPNFVTSTNFNDFVGDFNGTWKLWARNDNGIANNIPSMYYSTLKFLPNYSGPKWIADPSITVYQMDSSNIGTSLPISFPKSFYAAATNSYGCTTIDTATLTGLAPVPQINLSVSPTAVCNLATDSVTVTLIMDQAYADIYIGGFGYVSNPNNQDSIVVKLSTAYLGLNTEPYAMIATVNGNTAGACIAKDTVVITKAIPFEITSTTASPSTINLGGSSTLNATFKKADVYHPNFAISGNDVTIGQDTLVYVGSTPFSDTIKTNQLYIDLPSVTSTNFWVYLLQYDPGPETNVIVDSVNVTNPVVGRNILTLTQLNNNLKQYQYYFLVKSVAGSLTIKNAPYFNSGFLFHPVFGFTNYVGNASGAPSVGWLMPGDVMSASNFDITWAPSASITNANALPATASPTATTVYTLTTSNGCVQSSTVQVNVLTNGTDTAVTKCNSYTWYKNNTTYTTSGTYYSPIPNSSYFDTLVLTIDQPLVDDIYDTTCVTYTWPLTGQTYTAAGIYTYVDSVNCIQINLHLAIAPKPIIITHTQTPNATVCPGTTVSVVLNSVVSYTITPTLYYTAGATPTSFSVAPTIGYSYTLIGTDAQGCTGIHSVNIPVTSALVVNATASPSTICQGSSTTIAATGSSTALLPGAINYSITPTSTISNSTSTNNFVASPTSATTYTITGTSGGCSGTTSITVAVNTASNNATTQIACDSFTWNGTTYLTSGKYLYNYTNSNGCVSVDTLHLTINTSTTINTATATPNTICAGDSSILNAIVPPATNVTVSTFAGNNSGFADGTGTAAKFSYPGGVAIDALGNIYVAESDYSIIRKITPAGLVTTIAGDTTGVAGDTDGPAFTATFNYPTDVAVDANNNIYVCDGPNNKIRKITPAGIVSTLAGSGTAGNADGPGATASFSGAYGITVDAGGNVYVADQYNHSIRKITPAGVVSTFAGGTQGYLDGSGTVAQFSFPSNVAVDAADNIYVADAGNRRIRKITPAGVVSTFAGSGVQGIANGPAAVAQFVTPNGLFVDATGNVFVTDRDVDQIRKITPAGMVSTYAGIGTQGNTNGASSLAQFNSPNDIVVDASGNVFVADVENYRIRKITEVASTQTITWSPSVNAMNANMDSVKVFPIATTTYTVSVTNAASCTATKTVTVTVNANSNSSTTQTACDSFAWNGTTYTASGTYTNSTTNSCGTVVDTLILTINNATHNATTQTACNSFAWNGTTYTTSGTYTYNYNNANGCASVDTLYLTISATACSGTKESVTKCNSYFWSKNNTNYTASGIYYNAVPNSSFFDTLVLTITAPTTNVTNASACASYTWAKNNQTYTTSGNYTYFDSVACTIDTLNLIVGNDPSKITMNVTGPSLLCPGVNEVALNIELAPKIYVGSPGNGPKMNIAPGSVADSFPYILPITGVSDEYKLEQIVFNVVVQPLQPNVVNHADLDIWIESPDGSQTMLLSDWTSDTSTTSSITNFYINDKFAADTTGYIGSYLPTHGINNLPNTGEPAGISTSLASLTGSVNGNWKFFAKSDNPNGVNFEIYYFTFTFAPKNTNVQWVHGDSSMVATLEPFSGNYTGMDTPVSLPKQYIAMVTNGAGCTRLDSFTVNGYAAKPTINGITLANNPICVTNTQTITVATDSSIDSTTLLSNGWTSLGNYTFSKTQNPSANLDSTTFYFQLQSPSGCTTDSFIIYANAKLFEIAKIDTTSTSTCSTELNATIVKPGIFTGIRPANNNSPTRLILNNADTVLVCLFSNPAASTVTNKVWLALDTITSSDITIYMIEYNNTVSPATFTIIDSAAITNPVIGMNVTSFTNTYTVNNNNTFSNSYRFGLRTKTGQLFVPAYNGNGGASSFTYSPFENSNVFINKKPRIGIYKNGDTITNTSGFSFAWSPLAPSTNPIFVRPSSNTNYSLTASNGCIVTSSILVPISPSLGVLSQATALNALSYTGTGNEIYTHLDGAIVNYVDANCNLIATVNDGAGGNVLGSTTAQVNVDATVPTYNAQPYTRRHFDITPTNQGAATVTIYQTQNDFDDFNTTVASTNWPPLPTGSSDAAGIANLRVTQVHGIGGLGNGTPELITPTSVTWDATNNYWSITFPVDSFSSFFVHTGTVAPLAISGLTLTGKIVNNTDQLTWTTMAEKENSYFELLHSTDAVNYTSIYTTPSKANNGNSNALLSYQYTNTNPSSGNNYYKVVAIAKDGRKQASQVVQLSHFNSNITIYPNPVLDKLTVAYYSEKASKIMLNLFDATGRMITSQELKVNIGANNIPVDMTAIATGNYQLQVINTSGTIHTFKVSKQ
jgi:serine/threonine protein kinase, bacterial